MLRKQPLASASKACFTTSSRGSNRAPTDWAGVFFFSGIVGLTTYLGVWQTQRYNWKVDLLAKRAASLACEPVDLADVLAGLPTDGKKVRDEATVPVRVTGTLHTADQVLVGPRPPPEGAPSGSERMGFYVIAPLVLDNSNATFHEESSGGPALQQPYVLVNRGWVPADGGELREDATEPCRVTVSGILRGGEGGGQFAPPHASPASFGWFDLPSIAAALGGSPVRSPAASFFDVPFAIDAREVKGDGPGAKLGAVKALSGYGAVNTHPATHAAYAVTWFALAAFGIGMTFRRFKPKKSSGAAMFAAAQAKEAAKKAGAGLLAVHAVGHEEVSQR